MSTAPAMAVYSGLASFRSVIEPTPFIVIVGDEEYVTIDESVLCTRFLFAQSSLLVEREEFDESGAVLRTVYVRPTETQRWCQYRVGPGSYTVTGVEMVINSPQRCALSPRSYSSLDRRVRRQFVSPLSSVPEAPERSVEELSSDNSSDAATILLESDTETRTVILSSHLESTTEVTRSQDYSVLPSPLSNSSSVPTHASETSSKTTILKSPRTSLPVSGGCQQRIQDISTPISSLRKGKFLASTPSSLVNEVVSVPAFDSSSQLSIYECILSLRSHRGERSDLKNVDLASFPHQKVNYLPSKFNGNTVFELPPLPCIKGGGAAMLEGMDQRCDGHAWTETATTNISDPNGQLSFRYVKCLGHLRCVNDSCPHLERCGEINKKYWEGSTPEVLIPGRATDAPRRCIYFVEIIYKSTPICLRLCPCKMFYITSKDPRMSRACVHLGTHEHPVATGECREAMDIIRERVRDQVSKTPHAKASAISLAIGRELLLKGLVDESVEGSKLTEEDLAQVFEKWSAFSTPCVNNMIKDAKMHCGQGGFIDNIL